MQSNALNNKNQGDAIPTYGLFHLIDYTLKDAGLEWERSQNLLYLGRYEEGFRAYEARKRTGDLPIQKFDYPEWLGALSNSSPLQVEAGRGSNNQLGSELLGKTILIHTEQGYGDTILAARFIPQVKALVGENGKVILQCKPELHRLFKNVGADLLIKPEELPDTNQIKIDYHTSLMSLLGSLGVTPETIPSPATLHIPIEAKKKFAFLNSSPFEGEAGRGYHSASSDRHSPRTTAGMQEVEQRRSSCRGGNPKTENLLGRHSRENGNPEKPTQTKKHSELINAINQSSSNKIIKVGIIWTGSLTFKANDQRRLPLTAFLPLAEQPNIRLYSLQKGSAIKELYETGADAYIQDIGKLCEDFADTAAAIEQMDVIVMTDSSVAHLAASLNKKVINLLNDRPYWLYTLEKDRTPWYPSMEFIYQSKINKLDTLI